MLCIHLVYYFFVYFAIVGSLHIYFGFWSMSSFCSSVADLRGGFSFEKMSFQLELKELYDLYFYMLHMFW